MRLDINTLVRQVAAERDIEADKLIDAVAEAISSAARKHYKERSVRTEIDLEPARSQCWKVRNVVEEVEDPESEMTLEEAREVDPAARGRRRARAGPSTPRSSAASPPSRPARSSSSGSARRSAPWSTRTTSAASAR